MDILVVDDNRATRKVVRFALERRGHRVTEAQTAAVATNRCAASAPDLILLQDADLPDADSFDLVKSLRGLTGGSVPIVAFSDDIGSVAFLRSAGFDGAIMKPVQPTQLVEQVEAHLLRRHTLTAQGEAAREAAPQPRPRAPLFSVAPAQHLAQRCAELASQLAIVEGMTAAVLEESNVESVLSELLAACFNAGGLSGGALYLSKADGSFEVRYLGAWQRMPRAVEALIGGDHRFQAAMREGRELRLSGNELDAGKCHPLGVDTQEILLTPVRSGETIFGSLLAAPVRPSWMAWESLSRGVAQRIAQLCVHQRMREQQELIAANGRRQAALMAALVDNAPDVIAHLDRDGMIQFVNRPIQKNPNVKVVGRSFISFIREGERERVRNILARVVEHGEPMTYEIEATGTDDAPSWWSCRMGPVRQKGEVVGVVLICRDISMQRTIESRLRVADRLAAIGTLAAGVAHEINTPIQYVANNLDFVSACVKALTETESDGRGMSRAFALERLPGALADCAEGVARVGAITHAMRTFSHPGTRYDQVDVNDGLRATVELTRHQWKEHTSVELALDTELPEIMGSRAELNQVFLNLVVNAGHAIEDARKSDSRPGKIRITSQLDDTHVVIEISDNGCGIPIAARGRVYDLFFTTKEIGRGSGQGLALAYSIITGHAGTISFATEEGEGTTFTLRLPIDGQPEGQAEDAHS